MKKFIILAAVLALSVKFGLLKNPFESKPEFVNAYGSRAVLYATSWCGYCQKARTLLRQEQIPFEEYDIEKSTRGKDEYDQLNGNGVPLLIVNGEIIRGYNPNKIIALAKGS